MRFQGHIARYAATVAVVALGGNGTPVASATAGYRRQRLSEVPPRRGRNATACRSPTQWRWANRSGDIQGGVVPVHTLFSCLCRLYTPLLGSQFPSHNKSTLCAVKNSKGNSLDHLALTPFSIPKCAVPRLNPFPGPISPYSTPSPVPIRLRVKGTHTSGASSC